MTIGVESVLMMIGVESVLMMIESVLVRVEGVLVLDSARGHKKDAECREANR